MTKQTKHLALTANGNRADNHCDLPSTLDLSLAPLKPQNITLYYFQVTCPQTRVSSCNGHEKPNAKSTK